jgi:hypothetical protein
MELSFHWAGDRWAHAVVLRGGAGDPAWQAGEGARADVGDPAWPASPPITELSTVGSVGAVVGVGRAGRSHFSVSFRADDDAPDTLLVECACRVQGRAGWLGSTYSRSGAVVELAAEAADGPAARTIFWAYRVGPGGPGLRRDR